MLAAMLTDVAAAPAAPGRARVFASTLLRFFVVQLVVAKWSLAWLADRLGARWLFARLRRVTYEPMTSPRAWRHAFEDLGPTYVKLGQMIASSDGLFPPRYSEEFRRCLDAVPPFETSVVRATVEAELGRPVDGIFDRFDDRPAAAASIAQVHFAALPTGEEVAVKVQRPGIAERIRADVRIMRLQARILSWVVPFLHLANPVGIIDDLSKTLAEELDFRREARNMDEFNAIMAEADNADVAAPRAHWQLTSERVLVMEKFTGWRVDDYDAIRESPFDGEAKLLAGIRGWFQSVLLRGFFHGDVHAGNFMLLSDGRVGFLDFGIVGRFDREQRAMIAEYVLSFQSRDFARLADVLVRMGSVDAARLDPKAFAGDLERTFAPMVAASEAFRIKDIVPDMLRVAVKHRMRLPREFVLVTKQLVYLDRYAKAIGGPTMNVLTDLRVMGFLMTDMARFAS